MRETTAVAVIFSVGLAISLLFRTYWGVVFASVGIPVYLAYTAREQNILAKSRLYDRDLFVMIAIALAVILGFDYFWDPRAGLITLAVVVPIIAVIHDRIRRSKSRKNVQHG
ncbi:MAG: hypothetical protein J7K48_00170 [Thermococcus sp.]|uniref:Membrane protein n=1 Tax=Thermococcus guaymasensis DSM 11113 TaxID=1432656 RepID=A0A0X1KJS1_9EURY|nr:hypothetical protein [Thermococcus guaymasensis]AJC71513.1 membrane protein [Thermococcus guaymasensis DSM 11113]MCD6523408.1 hypothetical protein [Thermococcus sp.]